MMVWRVLQRLPPPAAAGLIAMLDSRTVDQRTQACTIQRCITAKPFDVAPLQLVTGKRRVAKRYLSTWFLLDLVSTIPFDIIARAYLRDTSGAPKLQLLAFLKARPLVFLVAVVLLTSAAGYQGALKSFRTPALPP